jgi:hypothetical protein
MTTKIAIRVTTKLGYMLTPALMPMPGSIPPPPLEFVEGAGAKGEAVEEKEVVLAGGLNGVNVGALG